jgi:uncharacterized protein (DUF736 family)
MAVIGIFSAVNDGYAGTIRTLNVNARVKIVANERKETGEHQTSASCSARLRSVRCGVGSSRARTSVICACA